METGRLVVHDGKMESGVESETGSYRPEAVVLVDGVDRLKVAVALLLGGRALSSGASVIRQARGEMRAINLP
jgi:hypothetical protein